MEVLQHGRGACRPAPSPLQARIAELEAMLAARLDGRRWDNAQAQRLGVTSQHNRLGAQVRYVGRGPGPPPEPAAAEDSLLLNQALAGLNEAHVAIRAYQAQLVRLGERLVYALEDERRHLARELHDEFGQVLTGLNLTLSAAERLSPELLQKRLSDAREQVSALIAQVRQRSLELRPVMLDEFGLHAALKGLIGRYCEQTGIMIAAHLEGLEQRFAPLHELTAYRIVQEALTNVARHAAVKEATLSVWVEGDRLLIVVEDQGRGFDLGGAQAAHTSSGLVGIWERAVLLGGDLAIESAPEKGTRLQAILPLNPPA